MLDIDSGLVGIIKLTLQHNFAIGYHNTNLRPLAFANLDIQNTRDWI